MGDIDKIEALKPEDEEFERIATERRRLLSLEPSTVGQDEKIELMLNLIKINDLYASARRMQINRQVTDQGVIISHLRDELRSNSEALKAHTEHEMAEMRNLSNRISQIVRQNEQEKQERLRGQQDRMNRETVEAEVQRKLTARLAEAENMRAGWLREQAEQQKRWADLIERYVGMGARSLGVLIGAGIPTTAAVWFRDGLSEFFKNLM